jgi:hypothetical protein
MNLKRLAIAAFLLAAALPARAIHIKIDKDDVPAGDVVVEKGQTHEGDLAAKGSVTVRGVVTGDCAAFGGALVVEGECRGEAASFGGPITLSGRVDRDVASFGGPVVISGTADREVAVFGGDLTVTSSGTVSRGVTVVGGRLNQETGAVIKGEIHNLDSRFLGSLVPGIAQAVSRAERRSHDRDEDEGPKRLVPVAPVALCLLTLVLALFLPAQVETVAAAAAADFWRSLGIGLLIAMGFVPALVAMAVSVLAIPFIPVALAALGAALVVATAAFYLLLGRRASRNLSRPEPGTIKAVAATGAGVAVVFLAAGLIPGLGGLLRLALFLTMCGGVTLGLGAVWTTRFGTRPAAKPADGEASAV